LEEGSEEGALQSAKEALEAFEPQFKAVRLAGLRRKLGLMEEREGDAALAEDLLTRMAENGADFTLTFRRLASAAAGHEADDSVRALFVQPTAYDAWAVDWRRRLAEENVSVEERVETMRLASPAIIPRNHVVEAVLNAAVERNDFEPFEELLRVIAQPYDDLPGLERYTTPALPAEQVHLTYCGT